MGELKQCNPCIEKLRNELRIHCHNRLTAYTAAMRSDPGGRIHSEGSNFTLKKAVVANMMLPSRVEIDVSVNGAGNRFSAGTCNSYHIKHKKQ